MLIPAVTILIGFIILIWSADLFVAGAASIAENFGMSPAIIGLTIVSMGTSAPEVLVSITAAMSGAGDLAIGNAIGSNIANMGLVLGVTLLVIPICVQRSAVRRELPVLLLVTAVVGLLILDYELSALDGWLMIGALALLIGLMMRSQTKDPELLSKAEEEALPHHKPLRAWLSFAAGLILLIASSRALVWGASEIALQLGVSELIIGLTIVAIGTSLPELAATIASALRGHAEIALGNVIGSNLFNLLAVMAIPGIVATEVLTPAVLQRDYATMSALTVGLALSIFLGFRHKLAPVGQAYIGRGIGLLFVTFYALYYCWLYFSL